MKPIVLGAVLALLWLVLGLPVAAPFGGVANLVQPVTVAFAAGILARPTLLQNWRRVR